MSIWIAGKNLMKLFYHLKIVNYYSELTLEDITDKDYKHAQKVFKEYCTDMGDSHICMFKRIHFCLQMFSKNLE